MRIIALALASVTLATVAAADVVERDVTLTSQGQAVVGTLATPPGPPAPVVLLLHGFTGARDELATEHVAAGVFGHAAQVLGDAGLASLRIDFRGSGDSVADLSFADTTFESQIADAAAAVAFLAARDDVDGADVHVIGWSQGGLVAASLAGRGAAIDSLSLWNAVGDPMATYGGLLGAETMAAGMSAAPGQAISASLPWGATIDLKGAFFAGVAAHDPVAEIKGYAGPLFVAVGAQDTTVTPDNGARYIAAHTGPNTLWTAPMDHVFNVFAEAETLDALLAETIAFIRAHDD